MLQLLVESEHRFDKSSENGGDTIRTSGGRRTHPGGPEHYFTSEESLHTNTRFFISSGDGRGRGGRATMQCRTGIASFDTSGDRSGEQASDGWRPVAKSRLVLGVGIHMTKNMLK